MRNWIMAGLGLLLVLLFAFGAEAITIENETVASGTTSIPITGLRGAYKILTVHPWTENVTATVLDRDGNAVEDWAVEAGSWRNIDISGAGSVIIVRTTATVVDWGVSVDRDAAIGGASGTEGTLGDITNKYGIWSDPDWDVETFYLADLEPTDAGEITWDMRGYTACYLKFLATTWSDSLLLTFGTSETQGWTGGNSSYFDIDPSTTTPDSWVIDDADDVLGAYGTTIPVLNTYGTWIPGPYGCLTVTNALPVGTAEDDSILVDGIIVILKRK